MKKDDKASISLIKIISISLIIIFVMGIAVAATNFKLTSVKVILANNYEMTVLTTKTKISEILLENHIALLEDEVVTPNLQEEISDNKTIIITKKDDSIKTTDKVEETVKIEEIVENYDKIVEKIVVEDVEIPYETITKDVSKGASSTKENIVKKGVNGLKKVTYKIKYKNDVEIERVEIASEIIRQPVNKIVEINKKVTDRSLTEPRTVTSNNGKWAYSASEIDLLCAITAQECGSSYQGALAVISCACNRAESAKWRKNGADPLSQYKARGQFCYSIDSHWKRKLNGNYSASVKQAVEDALAGKRNHSYLSFRSAGKANGVNIGGNVYF